MLTIATVVVLVVHVVFNVVFPWVDRQLVAHPVLG
jgi:quinol-cytochrome oxidoreductase complex cytochrome b subunit